MRRVGFYVGQVEENDINRDDCLFLDNANDGECGIYKRRSNESKRQIGCGDE